ncbi:MAG: hypothetical protein FWD79_11015 [Desulfobulbus sp.]|nr:hypothetical protein [Desulfobulbus sp.]
MISAGFALEVAKRDRGKYAGMVSDHPVVKALGLVDEDGMIDASMVYECAEGTLGKHADGGKLRFDAGPWGIFTFGRNDLKTIYEYVTMPR